ncbi:AAA family ATPase [Mycolicibacterium vanbaalenii]|nr:AAA family ATPase [Mycolicibacterium vanbaalenii]
MAHEQSLLLLSPPGVGKSDVTYQTAAAAGLECRSLLGTQIAPEDVSGIPRIVGERSVFCPPRVLLPESPEPFCLFLDELPASSPDVQKAFYSLLLERRIGEYRLPAGSWVVAAGNRAQDRALVRALSTALVNRVVVLNVRVDLHEWLVWADANTVRSDIKAFINFAPDALARPVPAEPVPFSTPRSWASLSRALDLVEQKGILDNSLRRALAFGRVSAQDAAVFCALAENNIAPPEPLHAYLTGAAELPAEDSARWFVLNWIREQVERVYIPDPYAYNYRLELVPDYHPEPDPALAGVTPDHVNRFLLGLPQEHRFAVLVDTIERWSHLGADESLLQTLVDVTGIY